MADRCEVHYHLMGDGRCTCKTESTMPRTIVFISGILQRINELEAQHGSLRAVARALRIDAGYLSRLKAGKKLDPSDAVLKKLGLRRMVQFCGHSR